MGGRNAMEGRVEVLYNGVWGTVRDSSWGMSDANVVCRMLGHGSALEAPTKTHFGEGNGVVLLDYVRCSGTEENLADCRSSFLFTHSSGQNDNAGVICDQVKSSGKSKF